MSNSLPRLHPDNHRTQLLAQPNENPYDHVTMSPLTPNQPPLRPYPNRSLSLAKRLIVFFSIVISAIVLTQELQIFPGLLRSLLTDLPPTPPPGIDPLTTTARDGTSVKIWRLRARGPTTRPALIFHGNGDNLASFVHVQRWLASHGITTYSVEFRGYSGRWSGWPSERGLYADAEAAFELLLHEEHITAGAALVLGSSVGTGIASHVAATFQPKALILLSPYSRFTDLVGEMPVMGYLTPFLWYDFPTIENIRKLRETCVIVAHGRLDTVVPFHHSGRIREAYQGSSGFTLIESNEAGHNDVLAYAQDRIAAALEGCWRQGLPADTSFPR